MLGSLLFNVSSFDAVSFAAATVVLFVVALAACALPARRAAGVDSALALRAEEQLAPPMARRALRSRRSMRHAVLVLALCAAAAGATPSGQAPARETRGQPAGTAIIRGRVVADGPGVQPVIANARVSIGPAGAAEPVFTDASGRFEFQWPSRRAYTLTAEKTGYAKTRYGSNIDLEPPFAIEIADAAIVDAIEIRTAEGRRGDRGGSSMTSAIPWSAPRCPRGCCSGSAARIAS